MLASFRHPNIVAVHAAGVEQGCPFVVMELIEGDSLGERLRHEGTLPEAEAVRICARLARALEAVHSRGILHRDLKPDNVLLRDGEPVLTDFGLAKDMTESEALSRTGVFMGTPGFAPPEQARLNKAALGPAADVYGLGATLYSLVTGCSPFAGEVGPDLLASMLAGAIPPSQLKAGLSADLDALCLTCLAPEVGDRYPSAAALAHDLERLLAGESPSGSGSRVGPSRVDRRSLVLVGGAAVSVLFLLAIALWTASGSGATPTRPSTDGQASGASDSDSARGAEADTLAIVRELLHREKRLEALDSLDSLESPPPELVWDAVLPEIEIHLERKTPKSSLELLERPAPRRLRTANDESRRQQRTLLAQRAVEAAMRLREELEKERVVPDVREVDRLVDYLLVADSLGSDYHLPLEAGRRLVSNVPLFLREKTSVREPYTRLALAVAKLSPNSTELQAQVGLLSNAAHGEMSPRFIPAMRRAIELNPSPPDLARRLRYSLRSALFAEQSDVEELDAITAILLEDPDLMPVRRNRILEEHADFLGHRGLFEEALQAVGLALKDHPDGRDWIARRACLLWLLGEREEGLSLAWQLLEGLTYTEHSTKFLDGPPRVSDEMIGDRVCRVVWQEARDQNTQRVLNQVARLANAIRTKNRRDWALRRWIPAQAWCELQLGRVDDAEETLQAAAEYHELYAREKKNGRGERVMQSRELARSYRLLVAQVTTHTDAVMVALAKLLGRVTGVYPSLRRFWKKR